jgi:hypothetical protein
VSDDDGKGVMTEGAGVKINACASRGHIDLAI